MPQDFNAICPPLFADTDPARLPCRSLAQKVLSWRPGADGNKTGLMLFGPTRTGKSRTAWELLRVLVAAGFGLVWFDSRRPFDRTLAERYRNEDAEQWLTERITKAPLLFIDDFGKEAMTERVERELFAVIDARTLLKLPTIITTNWTSATVREKVSADRRDPLVERLREFFDGICFEQENC